MIHLCNPNANDAKRKALKNERCRQQVSHGSTPKHLRISDVRFDIKFFERLETTAYNTQVMLSENIRYK